MKRSALLVSVWLLIVATAAALGQSGRGTITGTISDPAKAVIPGAAVEIKNMETGAVFKAGSTATGNYTLTELPTGVYQLSVSVPGFKQYSRSGITVLAAQTLRIDIVLEVGELTETVNVNADAPLLRTESGDLSVNIASSRVNESPLVGWYTNIRDHYSVTQLIPGAKYVERNTISISGMPANTQSLRVEGQEATTGLLLTATAQNTPSVEAIEEFGVQTSNYAAEYGQAGVAVFNVTMKSGTNQYHGSVYDYWKNEAFNASQPFINTKPRERRHDYGFTLGGPVRIPKVYDGRDKLLFFFSWEQYRQKLLYNNQYHTFPTLAYREGDFRQASTGRVLAKDPLGRDIIEGTIYDPMTERIVNGQRVRDPFPDNTIPRERFDPVASKIQDMIPLPTNSDVVNNYLNPWESPLTKTIPSLKLDYNINTRSKVSFYWSSTSHDEIQGLGPPGGDGMDSPITTHRATHTRGHTVRLSLDHTLSPTMLLHLGAGVQTLYQPGKQDYDSFDQLKELGLPGAQSTFFPNITGLSATQGGMKEMGASKTSEAWLLKPTGAASLTWVKNNHTYKFGAEMRIEGYPYNLLGTSMGSYTFNAQQTGLPSTLGQNLKGGSVGFPYASFLLGLVHSGDISVVSRFRHGKNAWALFAQDNWKATRKLTVDYGLRWDYQTYLKEQYGRVANFSPTTPNPSVGGLPGAVIFERDGVEFAKNYPHAWGPRLGLAYQMTPKTVLRGGVGITYGQTATENRMSLNVGPSNPFASASYGDPAILLKNGPPEPKPWPNLDPGQYPTPGTITSPPVAIDHNAGRPPRIVQWSFSVQREITQNLVVDIAYVGNRGAWWEANSLIDVNALTPERIASFGLDINNADDQALLTSQLNSARAAQRGFNVPPYAGFPMTSTVAQSLRPFPQFGTISYMWAPLGRNWYDALQLKVTKRFSHGLSLASNFVWQKELMMGSLAVGRPGGQAANSAPTNNVFDRPTNKYISGLSRPLVWTTDFSYSLPKWGPKPVAWILADWTLGGLLQYSSGMPIRVPTAQSKLANLLFRDTFANRVPGEPLWTVDINDWGSYNPYSDFVLNPNAWADPPAGQYGVSAAYYNDYREMRRPSEALSLGRVFRIKERASLSIRADFNNIFNRTVIGNPTSTNAQQTQVRSSSGETTSGFGDINTKAGLSPRSGMIVARFSF